MPHHVAVVNSTWELLTLSDAELMTVQMRPERSGPGGRLYLGRGTAEKPPPPRVGLFLDCAETSGIAGMDLVTLDPGGEGSRLYGRYVGEGECVVWCSWSEKQ